ncbi:SH3 domain-containing protein [Streptomyces sp. 4N124]|uniref:SH3 domain-containing protein n=1 Tax=Streptomyces sp. 4N124 TaxID=3457420 RepID=UPI003FCF2F24
MSNIDAGFDYDALCAQRGENVTAHGRTSDIWIKLLRTNGETGWVTATALTGDAETVVTTACLAARPIRPPMGPLSVTHGAPGDVDYVSTTGATNP